MAKKWSTIIFFPRAKISVTTSWKFWNIHRNSDEFLTSLREVMRGNGIIGPPPLLPFPPGTACHSLVLDGGAGGAGGSMFLLALRFPCKKESMCVRKN